MFSTNGASTAEVRAEDIFQSKRGKSKKATLDAHSRVRVEKLEVALQYLGIYLDDEKLHLLREKLNISDDGTVNYGEFVKVTRSVMRDNQSLDDQKLDASNSNSNITASHHEEHDSELALENEQLRNEVQDLQELLADSEANYSRAEQEIQRLRYKMDDGFPDIAARQNNANSVENAMQLQKLQRANIEYQDIIASLESQLNENHSAPEAAQKIAVLGCEVRKLETARRTYRSVVERLLHFSRATHMALRGEASAPGQAVSKEAELVLQEVREALHAQEVEDELPFAWEKAAARDGDSYYIKASAEQRKQSPSQSNDTMGKTSIQSLLQYEVDRPTVPTAIENRGGLSGGEGDAGRGDQHEQPKPPQTQRRLPRYRLDVLDADSVPVKLLSL